MSIMQLTQTIHILPTSQSRQDKYSTQPTLPGLEPEQDMPPMITNRQFAGALSSVAELLEFQNGNQYRIQAYRNAARGVLELNEPAVEIIARGERLPVPGLGQRLQFRIAELVHTGTMTFYDDLFFQSLPPAVRRLMAVEYILPHISFPFYEELGFDSPDKPACGTPQQHIRELRRIRPHSAARPQAPPAQLLYTTQPRP